MIVAVGTEHDVILYDTQQQNPFAFFKDIHYTRLTDLSWSKDGQLLIASSTDGFCSLITFEPNELGVEYIKEEEVEESVLDISGCEELLLDQEETTENTKPKKKNLLEQWTIKTPKKEKNRTGEVTNKRKVDEPNKLTPKRIKPIPVNDENVKKKENSISIVKKTEISSTKVNRFIMPSSLTSSPELPVKIILDESEARHGWKSGEDENKVSGVKITDEESSDSEEFCLHLDESDTSEILETKEEIPQTCVPKVETTSNNQTATEVVNLQDTNKPKRRIPLITLSSPKTKKK